MTGSSKHPTWIWIAVVVLAIVHHDFWWWDDRTLVLGFLPVGLAYHAVFSLVAAGLWALACRWAWPHEIEEWADAKDDSEEGSQ